jgi:hypothetical protein
VRKNGLRSTVVIPVLYTYSTHNYFFGAPPVTVLVKKRPNRTCSKTQVLSWCFDSLLVLTALPKNEKEDVTLFYTFVISMNES